MDYGTATIYGVVQGLTEFLPVSSSGHLALLPPLLKIPDPGVSFDLAMHLGTSLAVTAYYRKDMLNLIRALWSQFRPGPKAEEGEGARALNLAAAMAATFVMAGLFRKLAEEHFRTPVAIGANLMFFGVLMWASDRFGQNTGPTFNKRNWGKAVGVGIAQGMALFPGVSRSGATLTIQRFMGVPREEATHFSFLLSAPIIYAGLVLNLPHFMEQVRPEDYGTVVYGTVVSGVVGALAIHLFLRFVTRFGLGAFALYRLVLGAAILWWQLAS